MGLISFKVEVLIDRLYSWGLAPDFIVTAVGLALVAGLGWLNLKVGNGLSFEFFYLSVCIVIGWIAGERGAALCAAGSSGFLYGAEAAAGASWILFWNSLLRLLGFLAIGWLAAMAGKLTRDLERTVRQRTARLQDEAEDHAETAELLRETMQLFKQVTENVADVFWVTDATRTHFQYVSPEFEKVWGETRQALYLSPVLWSEGIHPEDRERVNRAVKTKQVAGRYDEEYRILRTDGSLRWIHDRAFPVKNESGAVYRIVGIAEDITERKRSERFLQSQRDMGIVLGSTSDLSGALQQLLDTALQLRGIDCGGVYLLDSATGELQIQCHRRLSRSFLQRISRYDADAVETRLVKAGQSLYMRCEQVPRSLDVFWGSEGLHALAIVPLRHQNIPLGLLVLASFREDEIQPQTRVAAEMLASQVAGAIARMRAEESLRGLQQQILEISDREQARIGQDIHDGLCQQLIGMALSANSLEQILASSRHPEASKARKICALLDEAITESRRVCRGLYPIRLRTQGLVPALEELAAAAGERYPIACCCKTTGGVPRCDVTTATHLYRIAQEALNNALKHSGARHVSIELRAADDTLLLAVSDDGKGLGPGASSNSGMGLHIMRYRAQLIGGRLSFESNGTGTAVSCQVPRRIPKNPAPQIEFSAADTSEP